MLKGILDLIAANVNIERLLDIFLKTGYYSDWNLGSQ
jgi:hypothetical protein